MVNIEDKLIPKPQSKFLRLECINCGNKQIVFGCATTTIKCNVCEKQLIQTTGGKVRVLTKISEVLN
jgi:small subunit ribosomal protein S27e